MSLKDQWYQARVQRQTAIAERHQGVTQLLNGFKQGDIQRKNKVQQNHQIAVADKQQRQTEIVERQQ